MEFRKKKYNFEVKNTQLKTWLVSHKLKYEGDNES